MAQAAAASLPANGPTGLTTEELHEILEYEKIVKFRDAVYSGSHPRIKIPQHLAGKPSRKTLSPNTLISRSSQPSTAAAPFTSATKTYKDGEKVGHSDKLPNGRQLTMEQPAAALPQGAKTNKSEINPILLEKSDDLIKAEIQLRRQRVERNLRDQVEQRRISMKAALQTSESLPDFDLSDVLSKALTIVHPSTASEAGQSVVARTSASDSFDENTFYSSQHDTPERSTSSRGRRESSEIHSHAIPRLSTHDNGPSLARYQDESQNVAMMDVSLSNDVVPRLQELARKQGSTPLSTPQSISHSANLVDNAIEISQRIETAKKDYHNTAATNVTRPIANAQQGLEGVSAISSSSNAPTSQNRRITSLTEIDVGTVASQGGPVDFPRQAASAKPQKRRLSVEEPETVRNFNLSPVAPQPARVSPLATAHAPVIPQQTFALQENSTATFSPVRAPVAGSTTVSSPKASKQAGRKEGKGKGSGPKTATGNNFNVEIAAPDSPYIKPEPRSPSPFTSAPFPRPHKRQRQTLQQGAGLDYDEPRYEEPREEIQGPPTPPRNRDIRQKPVYRGDERFYEPIEVDQSRHLRMGRDETHSHRIVGQEVYRGPSSPGIYAVPYSQYEQRPLRTSSRMVLDPYAQDPPRYYREPPAASATAIQIDSHHERSQSPILHERHSPIIMAPPPRVAPSRIVVDKYGNQYYTSAPALPRQSVAPQSRFIEQDYMYDRPPPRATRPPVQEVYEDHGVIYRRASPQYVPQRRVITMPENLAEPQLYRREYSTRPVAARPPVDDVIVVGEGEPVESRQREYSTRPVPTRPPIDDHVRVPGNTQRRQMTHFEEPPRDYEARIGSVRPEAFRHEDPREYIQRAQSIRPEPVRRDYAASVRPDGRREVPSQIIREYSVRPGESDVVRREYMPPPMDGYQPTRPMARRIAEETEYIPRREMHQDMYDDDIRQEVIYR